MVSDIRRQVLKSQEEADDQGQLMSDARTLYHTEPYSLPPRLKPGQPY